MPVSLLSDGDAQRLCLGWQTALRDNIRRIDLREGCLREALQEGPTNVSACESAFSECMSEVEEVEPLEVDPQSECDGATQELFAGCSFTARQLADCVNATLADYDRVVRSSDCSAMIAAGGQNHFDTVVDDAAIGRGASACASINWSCDQGSLQGFASIEEYGDD